MFEEIFDKDTISAVKGRMSEIVNEIDLSAKNATKIAVFSTENSNK